MTHGKPGKGFGPGLSGAFLDFLHVHDETAVGQHGALGHTGGAAGVDHRADIVDGQRVLDGLQLLGSIGMVGKILATNLINIFHRFYALHGNNCAKIFEMGEFLTDVADFLIQGRCLDHQQTHMGVVEDVLVVLLADSRIDGQKHSTRLLNAEVDIVPFGAAGGDEADILAALHAEVQQGVADEIDFFDVFVNVMVFPFAVFLELENGAFGMEGFPPLEQVKQTSRFLHRQ